MALPPSQNIDLPTVIQLKLAARRYQDLADVVNLIRANELDESFQEKLHPSVRADFIECVAEKQREDEYEARLDRAVEAGNESPAPGDAP